MKYFGLLFLILLLACASLPDEEVVDPDLQEPVTAAEEEYYTDETSDSEFVEPAEDEYFTDEMSDAPASAQASEPIVTVDENYYDITGSTADELRAQLDQLGPLDPWNERHDAQTDWFVSWSYPYADQADGCGTGPVTVEVNVTFTYPWWEPPATAAPDLVAHWEAYGEALRTHEDGHQQIGLETAWAVQQALNEVPPQATCAELDQLVDATGQQILDEFRQIEIDYDRETDHGATQGARFP